MNEWIIALPDWLEQGTNCVLLTVLSIVGSTPREVGASMLVRLDNNRQVESVGSIGGGHLEWQSMQIAKNILNQPTYLPIQIERFNLGARLGQCCGGRVWVLFETISSAQAERERWRHLVTCTQQGQRLYRYLSSTNNQSQWQVTSPINPHLTNTQFIFPSNKSTNISDESDWQFSQVIESTRFHLYLFGAGHIAQALVKLLLPLAVHVHWVETRDYQKMLDNIDLQHPKLDYQETDIPEQVIEYALPNSFFIVMTHDHGLDFQLCQTILKRQAERQDIRYFGMIGSTTKRQTFERRLLARGMSAALFDTFICPMGITGIHSKEPNVIAIAIVAQLLQVYI